MIRLDDSVIEQHPTWKHYKTPPTHAKLFMRHIVFLPPGLPGFDGGAHTARQDGIHAYYAFGTLNDAGEFVCASYCEPVHTAADMTDYGNHPVNEFVQSQFGQHYVEKLAKTAALKNLRGAGVVPTPGQPHVATEMPAAVEDDFCTYDLDVYFSHFDPRLKGEAI